MSTDQSNQMMVTKLIDIFKSYVDNKRDPAVENMTREIEKIRDDITEITFALRTLVQDAEREREHNKEKWVEIATSIQKVNDHIKVLCGEFDQKVTKLSETVREIQTQSTIEHKTNEAHDAIKKWFVIGIGSAILLALIASLFNMGRDFLVQLLQNTSL